MRNQIEPLLYVKRTIHNRVFTVCASTDIIEHVEVIFHVLSTIDPEVICDGYRVEIMWADYYLEQTGDNEYTVTTLDYLRDIDGPRIFDVKIPLRVQMLQVSMIQRFGLQDANNQDVAYHQQITLVKGVLDEPDVCLYRNPANDAADSGWLVSPADMKDWDLDLTDAPSLYTLSTYELLHVRPEWLQVLCLPCDYSIVFNGSKIEAVRDEKGFVIPNTLPW